MESKKIVSVGRLTYQKNFEAAIQVASQILIRYPDWTWDVYGQGEDMEKLQATAQECGIYAKMHFCGQVSDLYDRYRNYSLMVMTSRYEGFPMALLEGVGNGLPLVSFDIPTGPNEIIEDGVNGYLIEPFNIDRMVERISRLIENNVLRISMSQASFAKVSEFKEEEITPKWIKMFSEINTKK